MNKDDAEEYTQALGQVVAGGYRQIALGQRLGVPKALGLSTEKWVQQRLGGYVKYSVEERRAIQAALKADGYSQREIARVVGVKQSTVSRNMRGDANASRGIKNSKGSKANDDANASEPQPLDTITALGVKHASMVHRRSRNSALEKSVAAHHMSNFFVSLILKIHVDDVASVGRGARLHEYCR